MNVCRMWQKRVDIFEIEVIDHKLSYLNTLRSVHLPAVSTIDPIIIPNFLYNLLALYVFCYLIYII